MFQFWPQDFHWSWNLLRPIAASMFGGGEFHECYRTAERIKLGDFESWHMEWLGTAQRVKGLGEAAEAAEHPVTAKEHYLRASNYFRWAESVLDPEDLRRIPTYDECVLCFQKAGRYFSPPLETVEIPYEGSSLPAYFYPGSGQPRGPVPAVLYIAGADVLKEELYFMGGRAVVDRGMALLTMDGPGQGASLRHRKLHTRYDYEVPVRAAIDYLQTRPEVNPERIGVIGRSFGGYYAPRAVAFDARPKALVIFGAHYNVLEATQNLTRNKRHWLWLIGAQELEEAREKYKKFTLKGIMGRIRCPLLILHGEGDHLVPVEHAQRTYAEASCPKDLVIYRKREPGEVHCQYDNFPESIPMMMDWLCDRLGHRQP